MIDASTRIDICAHGSEGVKHSVRLNVSSVTPTADLFSSLSKASGGTPVYTHLWACYAANAGKDFSFLPPDSLAAFHSSKDTNTDGRYSEESTKFDYPEYGRPDGARENFTAKLHEVIIFGGTLKFHKSGKEYSVKYVFEEIEGSVSAGSDECIVLATENIEKDIEELVKYTLGKNIGTEELKASAQKLRALRNDFRFKILLQKRDYRQLSEFLNKKKIDPHDKAYYGITPLFYAQDKEAVELLIKHGVDPSTKAAYGETALHEALHNNRPEVALALIERMKPEDLAHKPFTNMGALDLALQHNNIDVSLALIHRMRLEDLQDPPALSHAKAEFKDIFKLFIANKGKEPHEIIQEVLAMEHSGALPLSEEANDVAAVYLNSKDESGVTNFDKIVKNGDIELIAVAARYTKITLEQAIENKNTVVALALIQKASPKDLAVSDTTGSTILMDQIYYNYTEIALALIDRMKPEDLAIQDDGKFTALKRAFTNDNKEVALALIDRMKPEDLQDLGVIFYAEAEFRDAFTFFIQNKGKEPHEVMRAAIAIESSGSVPLAKEVVTAYLSSKDRAGVTNLSKVIKTGDVELIKSVLTADADVHVVDNDGKTMLNHALELGKNADQILLPLLEAGADISKAAQYLHSNNPDPVKFSALLMTLASYAPGDESTTRTAKTLISYGAVLESRNSRDETALMMAAKKGNLALIKVLLKSGANVNVGDSKGNTAIGIAIESGQTAVIKPLLEAGARISPDEKGRLLEKMRSELPDKAAEIETILIENEAKIAAMKRVTAPKQVKIRAKPTAQELGLRIQDASANKPKIPRARVVSKNMGWGRFGSLLARTKRALEI